MDLGPAVFAVERFVLVLGVFRLRETPGRVRVLGGAATVLGVGLIAVFGGP